MARFPSAQIPRLLVPVVVAAAASIAPVSAAERDQPECLRQQTLAAISLPAHTQVADARLSHDSQTLMAQGSASTIPQANFPACTYAVPQVPRIEIQQPIRGLY